MAANVPAAHQVRADERAFGPKMRQLAPRHRLFVLEYAKCRNATEAARRAGYTAGPASGQAKAKGRGSGLRVTASRLLDRDDISQAIVEETLRRLKADLPVNLELVQQIATGKAGNEDRPVSHAIRLKALELIVNRAAPETLKVEHGGQVEVTVRDRWERVCRMAALRGEDPETLLRNLPPADQEAIRQALARQEAAASAIETTYEEIGEP